MQKTFTVLAVVISALAATLLSNALWLPISEPHRIGMLIGGFVMFVFAVTLLVAHDDANL